MNQTAFGKDSGSLTLPGEQMVSGRTEATPLSTMPAKLKDHQICMIIPAGSRVDALTLDLQGGILILGALRGRVNCATGSAIVASGGEFQGSLVANDVLIEGTGKVTSPADSSPGKGMSELVARGQADQQGRQIGGLVILSSAASVNARLCAVAFQVPRGVDLCRSVMETIVP